jgi:hypothetical protein
VLVHVMLDVGLGALLIASSFLFDFEDVSAARIFTIVLGVGELLAVVATRWLPAKAGARAARG